MTNTFFTPHKDAQANSLMAGQLKRGRAKSGYYYTNIEEDEGSVSAVVPSKEHIKVIHCNPQEVKLKKAGL